MRKRQKIKNISYMRKYNLKNIVEENTDGQKSISGTLCYKGIELIKFYEDTDPHSGGGYCAYGQPLNEKLYCQFLSEFADVKIKDLSYESKIGSNKPFNKKAYDRHWEVVNAFDKGIAILRHMDPSIRKDCEE